MADGGGLSDAGGAGDLAAPRIATPRLSLRGWTPTDAPALQRLLAKGVGHLDPWVPWAPTAPPAAGLADELIERWISEVRAGAGLRWAIEVTSSRELVGGIGLYDRLGGAGLEVGYWIGVGHIGRGYATETARAVVDVVRRTGFTDRLEMHIDPRNAPSAAVAERAGFTRAAESSATGLTIYRLEFA